MTDAAAPTPLSLRREGNGLLIEWSDGLRSFIAWKDLRKLCPCATCIEERQKPADPFKVLSPQQLAAGAPEPVKMAACGYYAYKITWNDSHDTGIYTLEYLRSICKPADNVAGKE